MKKFKLVLVRHGQSEWNLSNRFTGWVDVALTKQGIQEAKNAGKLLKQEGYKFTKYHTSYLRRAIDTLHLLSQEMNQQYLPVQKSWRLNERHYGGLTGLNKKEMQQKHGEEKVTMWRRSYDIRPPTQEEIGNLDPLPIYTDDLFIHPSQVPKSESLKDTLERVLPYFYDNIVPDILKGEQILISAHGNSLRALVKELEKMPENEIVKLNIPTGEPLVYTLNENLQVLDKQYIGDEEEIKKRIQEVQNQTKQQIF